MPRGAKTFSHSLVSFPSNPVRLFASRRLRLKKSSAEAQALTGGRDTSATGWFRSFILDEPKVTPLMSKDLVECPEHRQGSRNLHNGSPLLHLRLRPTRHWDLFCKLI